MAAAIFLDKDGTIVEDVPYNIDPDRVRLSPGTVEGLRLLCDAGYLLIVITNQAGVALGLYPESALAVVNKHLTSLLLELGIPLSGFYYCPHHPEGKVAEYATRCECRKPAPGLIRRATRELELDVGQSWFIGDILNDIEAGHRAGCRAVLIDNGNETEWNLSSLRRPDYIAADIYEAAKYILSERTRIGSHAEAPKRTLGRTTS
jgi:histidinol-phosphate phosphatase family protein